MPPHAGLTHLKEYDVKDSNVELIGTDIDHRVKYNSAATEPAWNNGTVGQVAGLYIWRIEDFAVVAWPQDKAGQFYDGDSYIVLHSYTVGRDHNNNDAAEKKQLAHDIFFWLGSHTSQDEAGTAAYKTVELDEFLHGQATQHRELQQAPSDGFVALFPRLAIRSGGVRSGFHHVDADAKPDEVVTLLRVFKHAAGGAGAGPSGGGGIVVHEVQPSWRSLDDDDVFVLDRGDKIWVWQGRNCSPMEKAKAAQVVHDMTIAKHVDVEVLSQAEARSKIVVDLLGGEGVEQTTFRAPRPIAGSKSDGADVRSQKLFRLSDASGQLSFELVKNGERVNRADLDSNDIFLLDTGNAIWIWQGQGASEGERGMWTKVAQSYVRQLQGSSEPGQEPHLTSIAKVVEGHESPAFLKVLN